MHEISDEPSLSRKRPHPLADTSDAHRQLKPVIVELSDTGSELDEQEEEEGDVESEGEDESLAACHESQQARKRQRTVIEIE